MLDEPNPRQTRVRWGLEDVRVTRTDTPELSVRGVGR